MDFKQKLLIFVGGSLTVLIYRYFKYRKSLQQLIEYHNKDISFVNEVIFFSGPRTSECDTHVSRKIICSSRNCPFRKLKVITDCIDACVKSLDICIHLVTIPEISTAILEARERGVKVRMLVDGDKALSKSSAVDYLVSKDVEIKIPKFDKCVHCKMAILDEAKLLTGSLNWTQQGIYGNWDNIIITSQEDILRDAIEDFNFMWQDTNTSYLKFITNVPR